MNRVFTSGDVVFKVFVETTTDVAIHVKPRSFPNAINLRSGGATLVAIKVILAFFKGDFG